jgi:predicted alpha/beta hydrolase family esterase
MTKQKQVSKRISMPLAIRITQIVFPVIEKISLRLAVQYFDRIFFTPFRYKTPVRELAAENAAEKFTIISNGKKIQCYQWGDPSKPYVMVMHGWAGRATQFRKFVPLFLDGGYRIIGFDGPAHGKSEGKRTTIADFSEAMNNLASVKGNPIAIIAHSFGGGASLYTITNGFPVKKLINIASPSIADRIIQSYLKVIGGSAKVGEGFKKLVKDKYGKSFEEFTALELIKKVPADFRFMIVHDRDDREVDIIHVQELVKVYPSARLELTTGLGHNRILKDELVILSCLAFIKEN